MAVIRPLLIGFATTLKHLFKKPITVNYPEQKVPMFPKYRGKQVLMRDENGLEKCVACGLCSVACPADAIYLEAAENDGTVQAGPRYASVYQIHKTRCIFCGYCEEACPGRRDLHGQGLRAGRLQQGRLRLGQGGPARAGDTSPAPASARGWRSGRAGVARQPQPPAPASASTDMQIGALGDIHGAFDTVQDDHGAAPRRAALGAGRRRGEQRRRVLHADRAALLDQGQQRRLRRHRRGAMAGQPPAPTLHYLPNGGPHTVGPVARRGARRHVRAELVSHAGRARCRRRAGRSAPGAARQARQEPRRQAPALRARRGARLQGAQRASTCS